MNSNYEFANHMAKDKQSVFFREAQERRAAKQAGGREDAWLTRAYVARTGAWLLQVANRAAGQVVHWRDAPGQPKTLPH